MTLSADGIFSGIPETDNHTWELVFRMTDHMNLTTSKTLLFSTLHVDVPEPFQTGDPFRFRISPNPFTHSTKIDFSIDRFSTVRLSMVNLQGQCVRTLIPEAGYAEGSYEVYWDGTSDAGKPLPTGIYFYQFRVNNESGNGKLLITR
jgi:hypothetical protein